MFQVFCQTFGFQEKIEGSFHNFPKQQIYKYIWLNIVSYTNADKHTNKMAYYYY